MIELVQLGEQSISIEILQNSKNLWKVSGVFGGVPITVSATEKRTAINRWRKAAENKVENCFAALAVTKRKA